MKWVGALVLLFAAFFFGNGRVTEERRKTENTRALLRLIETIEANIAHFSRPLPEIYADYADTLLEESGFLGVVRDRGIRAAWDEKPFPVLGGVSGEVAVLFSHLGEGERDEEREKCAYTAERIEKIITDETEKTKGREKLYRCLPVLAALGVILLFL